MKKSLIASLAALALSAPVLAQTQPNPENPSDGLTIAKFNEVWQGYVGEAADKKITPQYVCFPNYCGYSQAWANEKELVMLVSGTITNATPTQVVGSGFQTICVQKPSSMAMRVCVSSIGYVWTEGWNGSTWVAIKTIFSHFVG